MENQLSVVLFSYRLNDLYEELKKRTSYLGKMRNSDASYDLIDRLTLTSYEKFLSEGFVEDAAVQTYDWLRAFGRRVHNAMQIVTNYKQCDIYKDYGLTTDAASQANGAVIGKEYIIQCFTSQTQSTKNLCSADIQKGKITILTPDITLLSKTTDINYTINYTYVIKTALTATSSLGVSSVNVTKEIVNKKQGSIKCGNNDKVVLSDTLDFTFLDGSSVHLLSGVDIKVSISVTPTTPEPLQVGTYVLYHKNIGTGSSNSNGQYIEYYQVEKECDTSNWYSNCYRLSIDTRDCIVFTLERTSYFDASMIPSIDKHIEEAIINYVMYRWLEYVKPDEASEFFNKFEMHAHQAKDGMESETSMQQRRHNFF